MLLRDETGNLFWIGPPEHIELSCDTWMHADVLTDLVIQHMSLKVLPSASRHRHGGR